MSTCPATATGAEPEVNEYYESIARRLWKNVSEQKAGGDTDSQILSRVGAEMHELTLEGHRDPIVIACQVLTPANEAVETAIRNLSDSQLPVSTKSLLCLKVAKSLLGYVIANVCLAN